MASLKRLDAFVKPRDDLRSRSAIGGLITLVAASAATILFLSQIYLYVVGATRHSLHLSESTSRPVPDLTLAHLERQGKIPLLVHVTFPHVPCRHLETTLDGMHVRKVDLMQGHVALRTRPPTESELRTALGGQQTPPNHNPQEGGCTILGTLRIPFVGGTFSITLSKQAWTEANAFMIFKVNNPLNGGAAPYKMHNMSHYVHEISFGTPFPLSHHPLKDVSYMVDNLHGGVFLTHIDAKLIPTTHRRYFTTRDTYYQMSVTQHIVQPETLLSQHSGQQHLPGLVLQYDFSPLRVEYVETRDNIFGFISSLVSIVGGVFVTVGLVTGCLLHSAAAVAKKVD